MNCSYFGICGSCTLFGMSYQEQLQQKVTYQQNSFKELYFGDVDIIRSCESHFRSRAEFKIYHDNGKINYAMTSFDKQFLTIQSCQIVEQKIFDLMPKLLKQLEQNEILRERLFSLEFLMAHDEILVTLIYHKKLDELWKDEAKPLQEMFNIFIIGRSRGQKIVLTQDYVTNKIELKDNTFYVIQKEGAFTQPNSGVNRQMIEWVLANIKTSGDLCELYCGGGNFTIPLSTKFDRVLATEISKTSIASAKMSCQLSNRDNIEFIRMSSEEFTQALNQQREFTRLKGIDLDSYQFSTIFIDPPRSGVDDNTLELVKKFDQIIYISCNPTTLHRDLSKLIDTHKITKFAFFDQFSWTNHLECGVILAR